MAKIFEAAFTTKQINELWFFQ